jgi:hypothetical protein
MRNSFSMKSLVLLLPLLLLVSCGGGGGGGAGATSSGSTLGDVVVTAFSAPSTGAAGTGITVTGSVTNQGGVMTPAVAQIILAPTSDVTVDGGQLGFDFYSGFLGPGQSWNFSFKVTLPSNIANGTYYLNAVAAGDDPSVQGNNVWNSPIPFTVTGGTTCLPDGYETDNTAGTARTVTLGASQPHNHCEGTSDWMKFSATKETVYGIIAQKVGTMASPSLSVYGTDGVTMLAGTSFPAIYSRMTWTAPASGNYYLRVAPFWGTLSAGANTDYRITLGDVSHPDLIVENFWYQGAGMPGGLITVSDSIRNQGFADAGSFDVSVYISTDPVVTTADTLIGTRTVTSLAANQSTAGSWLNYALPMWPDGTYYLATIVNPTGANELVTSNNTSTVLPVTITAPTSCSPDAYEPDSSYTQAKSITVGAAPQAHNHCQDTSDWMSFAATAGNNYSIRVVRTSGYDTPCALLYDTNGTSLLAGDCNNSPQAIDWHANASGTYYIEVTGSIGNANEYTVQVQPQLPDLTQTLSINFPTVNAGGVLDVSDAVSNIGYAAAGPFAVGVYRSTAGTVTTGDTLVATRSLSGLPVQTSIWDTNQASYSVSFPKSLAPGTYYLAAIADHLNTVTELSETNNASQPIAVIVTAPTCSWDAYEDDDDPASAKPIALDEVQSRNYCDDSIDWVSFTPAADGTYVASSTSSIYLELYASDGTTKLTPHDTNMYSRLSWMATAGTQYYLKNYGGTGAYQLTVFQCTPDAYEDDDSPGAAKTITVGQSQTRNLCEDNQDWAQFSAVSGASYTIKATNGVNLWLELFNTDGSTHLAYGSLGSGQTKGMSVITWTAPSTGTYFIKTSPVWGFGKNLDYTLSLN